MRPKGFTVIEVMIVLAIAGLIMVIVFMAVPALQRNSRNTQRRSDASKLFAAYKEVSNSRNAAILGPSWSDRTDIGDAGEAANSVLKAANPGIITRLVISNVIKDTGYNPPGGVTSDAGVNYTDNIIRTSAKCGTKSAYYSSLSGSRNQLAVFFIVETSTGVEINCIDG